MEDSIIFWLSVIVGVLLIAFPEIFEGDKKDE